MKLSKEDFMSAVKNMVGENTDDNSLKFVEDMSDTYNEFEQTTAGTDDWKQKFEENDKTWREKYRDRFYSSGEEDKKKEEEHEEESEDEADDITIDDLFQESEG